MSIAINNLKIALDDDKMVLRKQALEKLGVRESDVKDFKILRESIDARRGDIKLVYRVSISLNSTEAEEKLLKKNRDNNISILKDKTYSIEKGNHKLQNRPIVVGSGPAGLFCALRLAEYGLKPIILERGLDVDGRDKAISRFWNQGILDPNSNVQFGEGGAGTFSDGKLTTRIKDVRKDFIIDKFIEHGAPEEISYSHKPHIGTDLLKGIVKNIRKEIVSLGGDFRFSSKVTDLSIEDSSLQSVIVNDSESLDTDIAVLAIGHSARDTYTMLNDKNLSMSQKPFAVGLRVEHLQTSIDENQYGDYANHPKLKSAEYKLSNKLGDERSCYSFCMCPGGTVVNASSEPGHLVVNGMSEYARDKINSNSAIVVTVKTEDFGSNHVLAGMHFQRKIEKKAFEISEDGKSVPVQLLGDFIESKVSRSIGSIEPSSPSGYIFRDLNICLPQFVSDGIKRSMVAFGKKISGFDNKDVVLTGVETRTSAPIRIGRDDRLESDNIEGLYPCGEGAGYAGGIVSAAVDGVKVAESIISKYTY